MKTILFTALLFFSFQSFTQEEESTADTCFLQLPQFLEATCHEPFLETKANCEIDTFNIIIFNRWGEIQFESTDIDNHWYAAKAKDGVYVWKIFIRFLSGKEWEGNGHFTVLK